MSIKIQAIAINIFQMSMFPNDRVSTLVSELHVHYEKINSYIDSKISDEVMEIEMIGALSVLKEISRLTSSEGEKILNSVIALLSCSAGSVEIRGKYKEFSLECLDGLFSGSLDCFIDQSLFYRWLKKNNLVGEDYNCQWFPEDDFFPGDDENKCRRIVFSPDEKDIDQFYKKNKIRIYEDMVSEQNQFRDLRDPFDGAEAQDFYHYKMMLDEVEI